MSFTITQPGFYRQRDGEKAEVIAIGRGTAFGFRSDGDAVNWRAETGRFFYDENDGESYCDLVAVWSDPPRFKVGDRVRVNDEWPVRQLRGFRGVVRQFRDGLVEVVNDSDGSLSAWHPSNLEPDPRPDPGDGWRLLDDAEVPCGETDQICFQEYGGWYRILNDLLSGRPVAEIRQDRTGRWHDIYFRRRVWTPTGNTRTERELRSGTETKWEPVVSPQVTED